jgi:CHASE2 domain-containing sensor protein
MGSDWPSNLQRLRLALVKAWRAAGNRATRMSARLRAILLWARILPRKADQPLGKYVWKHLHVLLIVFVITFVAQTMGWLRGFETYSLDVLLRLRAPQPRANLYLVVIDDEDYQSLFNRNSPLDPEKVQAILHSVARARPRLIGVDLETSHPNFKELKAADWPEAVWVRNSQSVLPHEDTEASQHSGHHSVVPILRGDALGGTLRELPRDEQGVIETTPRSGVPLFPRDHDGIIRRYRRVYFSPGSESDPHKAGHVDAFPWAIVKDYCRKYGDDERLSQVVLEEIEAPPGKLEEEIYLNFAGERATFKRINAHDVLQGAQQDYWQERSKLRDAIVIVGGTYAEGRDVYTTPVGPRHGVELIAHAIETDLMGGGIREFNHHLAHALDVVVGLLFLAVTWRFPGRGAFHIALAAIVILSLAASLVAFQALAFWLNFVPILVGQLLHLEWERGKERRELRQEVERLRRELEMRRGETN